MLFALLLIFLLYSSFTLAQLPCMGRGYKSSNGECICKTSYYGRNCQYKHCPFGPSWLAIPKKDNERNDQLSECSDMGYCEPLDGTCLCRPGYEGRACERLSCPASLVDVSLETNTKARALANSSEIVVEKPKQKLIPCSGHGVCKTMREAASEYDGWRLTTPPVDYINWDADRVTGCVCDNGWDGPDCSLRSCPYGVDPLNKSSDDKYETFQLECKADSGYFTLIVQGTPTIPIPFDADPSLLEAALTSIPAIKKVKVSMEIPKYYDSNRLTFGTESSDPNFPPLQASTGQVSVDDQLTDDYLPRVCNKNFPVKTKIVFYDLIPGQDASSPLRFSSGKGTRIGHKSGSRILLLPYAISHSAWQKQVEEQNINGYDEFVKDQNPLNKRVKIDHATAKKKNLFKLPPINLSSTNQPIIRMSTVHAITCPVCPNCSGNIKFLYNNDEKTTVSIDIFDNNFVNTLQDELTKIITSSASGAGNFGSNSFYSRKSNNGTQSINEGVDSSFPSSDDSLTNPWNNFEIEIKIARSDMAVNSICSTTHEHTTYILFHSSYGNLPFLNIVDNTIQDTTVPVASQSPIPFDFFTHKGTINFFECSNQGLCDREIGICQCFQDYDYSTNRFVYRVLSSDGNNKLGSIPDCGYTTHPPLHSCTLRGDDVCNGHGKCDPINSKCDCYEGWFGIGCNLRTCPYSTAWFDEALGPYNAHNIAECGNRGYCDRRSGNCICSHGFTGVSCEIKDCPREENGEACSGYGTCVNIHTFSNLFGYKYGDSIASDSDIDGNIIYQNEKSVDSITNNGKGLNFDNLYITKDISNNKISYDNGGRIYDKSSLNSKMDVIFNKKIGGGGASLDPYQLHKGITGLDELKKTWDAFKWYECLCHSSVPKGSIGHPDEIPRVSSAPISGKYPGGQTLPGWKGYDCSWRRCPRAHNPTPNPNHELFPETIDAQIPIQRLTCSLTSNDGFYLSFNSYVLENKIQKISSVNYFSNQKSLLIYPTDTIDTLQKKINEGPLNLGNVTIRFVDSFNKAINNELDAIICDPSYSINGNAIAIFFLNDIRELPLLKITMDALPAIPAGLEISMVSKGYGSNEECGGPNYGFCDPVSGICKCDKGYSSSDGLGNPGAIGDCTYKIPI